ncbi:GlxA family transcriptional regulator [uncultured Shewanella sp.]|uniref:GlxA family transcriptional regulator n=1 Tax=uncultured Shewanella sp. TaxID=173975 RepID=UPI00261ECF8E|nr:helix-turn-helix domain-containing protein [uncultured Shewanella sp.]
MKKVVILAAENCVLSTIAAPMDMFLQTGVLWNMTVGEKPSPEFEVKIVTTDGKPITALNHFSVIPACSMYDIKEVDLIVIPSQGFFYEVTSDAHKEKVTWLIEWYEKGADLAAICAGAFTLASTGLLNGKKATTHWSLANQFRKLFPKVTLQTECMITEEDRLFCGGGITADLNLSLHLIEKYCGREAALQSSRCMLVDLDRTSQALFAVFLPNKEHEDEIILQAQEWIEKNFQESIQMEALAKKSGTSLRQFNRRFKAATGETANKYVQFTRVEAAKMLLVTTNLSFEAISPQVGYENISFLRRIFRSCTGITPTEFRRKFGQPNND